MNVWVRLTRRRVQCYHCHQFIETGEYQVVCRYYMKRKDKIWTKDMHFHAKDPYCWIDQAVAELMTRPHLETRGRKANALSDKDKAERLKIMRRRGSLLQRIGQAYDSGRIDKLGRLAELLGKLANEIEPYGGVPKAWK